MSGWYSRRMRTACPPIVTAPGKPEGSPSWIRAGSSSKARSGGASSKEARAHPGSVGAPEAAPGMPRSPRVSGQPPLRPRTVRARPARRPPLDLPATEGDQREDGGGEGDASLDDSKVRCALHRGTIRNGALVWEGSAGRRILAMALTLTRRTRPSTAAARNASQIRQCPGTKQAHPRPLSGADGVHAPSGALPAPLNALEDQIGARKTDRASFRVNGSTISHPRPDGVPLHLRGRHAAQPPHSPETSQSFVLTRICSKR